MSDYWGPSTGNSGMQSHASTPDEEAQQVPPNFAQMSYAKQINWLCKQMVELIPIVNGLSATVNTLCLQTDTIQQEITQQSGNIALLRTEVNDLTQNIHLQTASAPVGGPLFGPAGAARTSGNSGPSSASIPPPAPASTYKLVKPDKFNRTKREDLLKFELACHMYLRAMNPNAMAEAKVTFILSCLEGGARDWLEPYMEQDLVHNNPIPFLHDYNLFWTEFKSRYRVVNRDENNCQKLKNLTQKGSVQDYLSLFQTYSAMLGYNDIAFKHNFYDGLSNEVVDDLISQNFDVDSATFHQLTTRALAIDKRRTAKKKAPSTASRTNTSNYTPASSSISSGTCEQLNKGDKVFMIGTDGCAKKGTIMEIGKNTCGKAIPTVKWNSKTARVQIPFTSIRKDMRPILAPTLTTTRLAKGSSPGLMELDGNKGKSTLSSHMCGGKGHFVCECPSHPTTGHEARVEEVESEEEVESLKGDA